MIRELTKAQRDWLDGELLVWQRMGLISGEQAREVLGLYESADSIEARQHSKGLTTILGLAATFVALGVLLLVGYNWEAMPPLLKIVAVFGLLFGTHAAAFVFRYQYQWLRLSEVAFFLGCLFFGAAIFLLGQIFQISSENYDALWWWALCTLPFALLLDTILLDLLFGVLLASWLGFEVLALERLFWATIHSAGYTAPMLLAPLLWSAYRRNRPAVVGIAVAVLAWWVILLPIAWRLQADPSFLIGAVGSLLLLVAAMHPPRSPLAMPYRVFGAGLVAGTLIPLSFYSWNQAVRGYHGQPVANGAEQMLIILIVSALTFIVAYLFQRKAVETAKGPRVSPLASLLEIARRHALPFAMLALFTFLAVWAPSTRDWVVPTIAANLAMIGLAVWLIRLGLLEDRGRPFGAGVAYLLLWTLLRYADLFGAFGGMLGAALIFFLCGAALFGVALYWRKRKKVSYV